MIYYVSNFSWSASSACLPLFSLLCKCRFDWTAALQKMSGWAIHWIGSKSCGLFQVRCSRWRYRDHRVQTPHVKLSAFEFRFSLGALSQQTARSSAHPETLLHACIFIISEAKGSEHADGAANLVTLSADLVAFQNTSAWLNCQKRLATKLATFSGLLEECWCWDQKVLATKWYEPHVLSSCPEWAAGVWVLSESTLAVSLTA